MSSKEVKFYGKVLLFGEYSVLKGFDALTLPHEDYFGQLKLDRSKLNRMQSSHAKDLLSLAFYIKELCQKRLINFDIDRLFEELEQGLYFSSNIPMGHGLGSSGALSAAMYHRYVQDRDQTSLNDHLRKELALIESFYHQKSSGIDPLLSLFGKALYHQENSLNFIDVPDWSEFKEHSFFLIDTEQSRQTDKLVDLFRHMLKSGEIAKSDFDSLGETTNQCIHYFLNKNEDLLWESFAELSRLQIKCLSAMVPLDFAKSWRNLLKENHTYLKLCGAGGGGFLLGLTKKPSKVTDIFGNYSIQFF